MKKIFVMIAMLLACVYCYADNYSPKPPIQFEFSAFLDIPVSEDSEFKQYFSKRGVYRTFGVFCEKSVKNCQLSVYDISEEYCNGKGSPSSLDYIGFNFNFYPDISLRQFDSEVSFEFNDNSLYGYTHNAFKITLAPKPNSITRIIATHIEGIANATQTSQGVPLKSRYQELEKRVLCNLGFFPPEK